jgi:hypothetical protein
MRPDKRFSVRRPLSRIGVRGLFVTAGVLCLLVLTLSSFAINRPDKKQAVGNNEDKTSASHPKAVLEPIALAAPSPKAAGNLDQVRNGGVGCDVTSTCEDPADWVNGNAGASNAHYTEGESIPYRLVMTGLSLGVHNLRIEWDITHGGANAIDFITHYQQGVSEAILPCGTGANHPEDLIAGCNPGSFDTAPIPAPIGVNSPVAGQPVNAFNVVPAGQRVMTIYNGTLNDATGLTYVSSGDLSLSQAATQMNIQFTAASSTVVLAWGGHIARGVDWNGASASSISGSPYHTRFISLDGSGGNQDRSLSAAAVQPPQGCTLGNLTPDVCAGALVTHSSTAVAGQTYSFSLVNNGGSASIVAGTLDEDPAGGTVSAQVQTSGAGSYTLTLTTTTAGGSETCPATVTVHAPPAADAGAPSYEQCETSGFAFTMSGATSTVPTGGTRTWTVSPADGATISDAGAANPTITLNGVGVVTATLTVTGASCDPAVDSSVLTVNRNASANAGGDQTVCASSPSVTLAGSFSGSATSASWSGGAGNFNPGNTALNATYTPSAAEIAAGTVTLTLTTNDPTGSCNAGSDTMTITINPNPTVDIGLVDACAGTAHLHATVTGGNGTIHYVWKKNNVNLNVDSADLTLSGPGTYTVSVSDSSVPSCGSNTDTFVVCYTEGSAASAPLQVTPNSQNAAIKPKSEASSLLARLATYVVSTFAMAIF